MQQYAGLDVSLEQTSVCVVDGTGGGLCAKRRSRASLEALLAWFAARARRSDDADWS
jgi:hypothetical protein